MATGMMQRRGTAAEWTSSNEVLPDGAIGINEDTGQIKMGDGTHGWNDLPYSTMSPVIFDAKGDLIVGTGDNTFARLPVGTVNQLLTAQADGSLAWGTPDASPKSLITTRGDLIVGNSANAPVRLPRGTQGQQLQVQSTGDLFWVTPDVVPLSKITAAGDLLIGNGNAVVINLAKGTTGQLLTMAGGMPAWATPAAPIPLSTVTTAGDLIVASGNAAVSRLAKGANGKFLTVTGGNVVWGDQSADVPLSTVTAASDLIVGSGAGAVARLAKGANDTVLGVDPSGTFGYRDLTPVPKGVMSSAYLTSNVQTPGNGAETNVISAPSFTVVNGRRYRVRVITYLMRSTAVADVSALRIRLDTATSGTQLLSTWNIVQASLIAPQVLFELIFVGGASTVTNGTNVPVTVAAGAHTFHFSMTKNSGSANSDTMGAISTSTSPTVIIVEDIGV